MFFIMFSRLLCWLFGHKYYFIRPVHVWSRKIGCKRCRSAWMMNDEVPALVPWTEDFDQLESNIRGLGHTED